MIEEGKALFVQIAESVEDSILDGSLAEDTRAPSTNELATFYRINPATAAKGVNMLVDKGVLVKRRGVGMFVAPGARELLLDAGRRAYVADVLDPALAQAARLGIPRSVVLARVEASALAASSDDAPRGEDAP